MAALLSACGAATVRDDARASQAGPELRIGIPSEVRARLDAHAEAQAASSSESESESVPESLSESESVSASGSASDSGSGVGSEPAPEPSTALVAATYMADARRHVAHTYRDEIQGCFDAAYARDAALAGRVVVAMVPHEDGRVASSRVVSNETRDVQVGECVMLAARAWELPRPPRRTLEVQLRFTI